MLLRSGAMSLGATTPAGPGLVLGPMLRFVGETQATVWVEANAACEVEVLGRRACTFQVAGHHYGVVVLDGLEPGRAYEYQVRLDGDGVWPEPGSGFPPSYRGVLGDGAVVNGNSSSRIWLKPWSEPPGLQRLSGQHVRPFGCGSYSLGVPGAAVLGRPVGSCSRCSPQSPRGSSFTVSTNR